MTGHDIQWRRMTKQDALAILGEEKGTLSMECFVPIILRPTMACTSLSNDEHGRRRAEAISDCCRVDLIVQIAHHKQESAPLLLLLSLFFVGGLRYRKRRYRNSRSVRVL